jgi:hypothetical protein
MHWQTVITRDITHDSDRWAYILHHNGVWCGGARNLRSHDAAQQAIEADKRRLTFDVPSIHEQLEALGL